MAAKHKTSLFISGLIPFVLMFFVFIISAVEWFFKNEIWWMAAWPVALFVAAINYLAIRYFIKSKLLIILSVVLSCMPYYFAGVFFVGKIDTPFSAHFIGITLVFFWLYCAIVGICFSVFPKIFRIGE